MHHTRNNSGSGPRPTFSSRNYSKPKGFGDFGVDAKELFASLPRSHWEIKKPTDTGDIRIKLEDFRDVASYNWVDCQEPTMVVPGTPHDWIPPELPFKVERDQADMVVSMNQDRLPDHPMYPLITSVKAMNPSFDLSSMDIVTDRNNLRKIMRWLDGSNKQNWRIDIQRVGDTLYMQRWEHQSKVAQDIVVYGRNFAKQVLDYPYLGSHDRQSASFHRVVQYRLDGLEILMSLVTHAFDRFFVEEDEKTYSSPSGSEDEDEEVDELSTILGHLAVTPSFQGKHPIKVIKYGKMESPSGFMEFKTRSENTLKRYGIDWRELYPEMYFAQASGVYIAVHKEGEFRKIDTYTMEHETVQEAALNSQDTIKQLVSILHLLKDISDGIDPINPLEGPKGPPRLRFALSCCRGKVRVHCGDELKDFVDPSVAE